MTGAKGGEMRPSAQLALLVAVFGLALAAPAHGGTGNDACVSRINNDARKVVDARAKGDRKCVQTHPGGNATACVDGSDATTEARKATLSSHFQSTCASPPAFGMAASAAAVNSAAE